MSELTDLVITITTIVLPFVFGFLTREPKYQKAKTKLTDIRTFLVKVDDALYDDKITEKEFREIYDTGKKMIDSKSE